jgi:hypothetical protein
MPTLEEVEAAFSQWRSSKAQYERVPEKLMEMARALVAAHGVAAVSKRLGVRSRKFLPKAPVTGSEFVEMAMPESLSSSIVVSMKLSSKRELTLTIPGGNIAAVSELLKTISKL